MTDLLSTAPRRTAAPAPDAPGGWPVTAYAVAAGLVASLSVMSGCMAVALAGWFAADAGRYGDTRDALRVGADGWLLAHGSGLSLDTATVTLLPLGLTLLCGYVVHRLGRWAAERSQPDDLRATLTLTTLLATVYALVALVTAVLAAHVVAQPGLLRTFVGGLVLAAVAGGTGVLRGSGQERRLRATLPGWAVPTLRGGAATVLLVLAAGALLLATGLLLDLGTGANVMARLHAGGAGGLLLTLVGVAFVPNGVVLAASYLLGPGFMVGAGTVVSPAAVVLGPVPAFPLLAALPDDGATPGWTTWLVGVPVVLAAAATFLTSRRDGVTRYEAGAARGLGSGLLAAASVALLAAVAGGSAGPGRMTVVGPDAISVLLAAVAALGAGGLLGGVAATWWCRRRESTTETAEH
jgi:hypothetical protein